MARTTIPAELVAVNAIQGTLIADNAITAVHIATNAVSGTLVADNSITSTHIAQNNVTATQIAQNTITVTQLADSAVETAKLNNDAVTQAKIADDAVGADQLAANSVVSASIVNGSIVEADMADNAVTLAKMASLARGSIIVGDSAGDPSALSIGSNTYVLTSDGTDISWAAASGGVDGISSSADATAMTIDSNENVGIGTTSPNHYANYKTLTIDSPGSGSGAVIDLEYRTTRSLSMFSESGGSTVREIRDATLSLGANNSNKMTIHSSGCVGVGSTTDRSLGTNIGTLVVNGSAGGGLWLSPNDSSAMTSKIYAQANGSVGDLIINNGTGVGSGGIRFQTNESEKMLLESGGDLTVGTSSLGFHFDVSTQTFSTKFGTGGNLTLAVTNSSGTGVGGEIFLGGSTRGDALKNCIVFRNASNSEKMRMAENGSFNIGTGGGEANGSTGGASFSADTSDRRNFICATTGTGTLELIEFRNPNGTVGTIKSSGSSTSYNTSSDYRLKENVEYTWDATSRLKQLKPARFNFKVDADTTLDGFLAHEVSSIVPQAISGEKDGEKMQSIDHSKLVPLLVKTIQELEARITTLEG